MPTSPSAVTPDTTGGSFVSRPAVIAFPPRPDGVEFRAQLESKYLAMGRRPAAVIVDQEGEATWIGEYYRYRVNGCDHDTATQRALAQIDGAPPGQICSLLVFPENAVYPPRDHVVDFRRQLGAKYQAMAAPRNRRWIPKARRSGSVSTIAIGPAAATMRPRRRR